MKITVACAFVFALFLTGICHPASSQNIDLSVSKRELLSNTTRMHKVIGHDKDHFYAIRFSGTQYFLEKLDKNLNSMLEEPIKLFKGLKTYDLESVVHFHDALYVFVSRNRLYDITLYYLKIDKDNLQPLTDLIEITTVKSIKGSWADFHFALSRNETRLLIASRIKLPWSHAQFNELYVFGDNLDLIWKRKDSFEFQGSGPRDNYYLVDEAGNVSVLSLLKRESIFSLISNVKNLYSIYRYTANGSSFKEYPVSLADRYIRGIKIIGTEQGELICGGLYSEIYKTGIRGTFYFKIDAVSGQVYDYTINGFDDGVLSELADMKEPMIKEEELISYVINDMLIRENNKVIIIAEQVFHQTYNTYNNLIVTCYDTDGQVYWTRIIGKKQNFNFNTIASTGIDLVDFRSYIRDSGFLSQGIENYCSYALMAPLDKNSIMLVYNDNSANLENSSKNRALSRLKKSCLIALTIDEFGSISKKTLNIWKKKELFPEPIRFYDTLHDTIVIPAFRNRYINYYKITAYLTL